MCQALREIMEEDFRKAEARGATNGVYTTLSDLVKKKLLSVTDVAEQAGVSEADFLKNAGLIAAQ